MFGFQFLGNEENTSSTATAQDVIGRNGLKFLAGYVAHRFRLEYPESGSTNLDDPNCSWISTLNKGNLLHPSNNFLKAICYSEEVFNQFHGSGLKKIPFIIQDVLIKVKEQYSCIPDTVLSCFIRTRTFIRLKHLNKIIMNEKRIPKDKKLKKNC